MCKRLGALANLPKSVASETWSAGAGVSTPMPRKESGLDELCRCLHESGVVCGRRGGVLHAGGRVPGGGAGPRRLPGCCGGPRGHRGVAVALTAAAALQRPLPRAGPALPSPLPS